MPLGRTFERISPHWETVHNPANEQTKSAVPDPLSERWLNNSGALGVYALTGTALYYNSDALSVDGTFEFKQWYDGTYELARAATGVAGGIGAFGVKVGEEGYYIGEQCDTVVVVTDGSASPFNVSGYATIPTGGGDNKLYGVKITMTSNDTFVQMGPATVEPRTWHNRPFTEDDMIADYNPLGWIYATEDVFNLLETGETWKPQSTADLFNLGELPRTSNPTYGGFGCRNQVVSTTTFNIFPIYNGPQAGSAKFTFSDDYGDTISTQSFGGSNGTPVGDLDDFGNGIVLAAYGGTLEYTNGDYKGVFNQASGANVAPYHHGCIRIPFLRPSNVALRNNDPTATEFCFAPSSKLDDDSTFWLATIDSTNGVVSNGLDRTPSFNGTPYVVVPGHGEQIEMNPTNPNVILGLFRPYTGGNTEILLTIDGGQNWVSKGQYNYNFVRWSSIGNTGAWFAGPAGFAYTPNRGATINNRNGDYSFIGTVENARGIFPVQ